MNMCFRVVCKGVRRSDKEKGEGVRACHHRTRSTKFLQNLNNLHSSVLQITEEKVGHVGAGK